MQKKEQNYIFSQYHDFSTSSWLIEDPKTPTWSNTSIGKFIQNYKHLIKIHFNLQLNLGRRLFFHPHMYNVTDINKTYSQETNLWLIMDWFEENHFDSKSYSIDLSLGSRNNMWDLYFFGHGMWDLVVYFWRKITLGRLIRANLLLLELERQSND